MRGVDESKTAGIGSIAEPQGKRVLSAASSSERLIGALPDG
jgi:hypothetical protein